MKTTDPILSKLPLFAASLLLTGLMATGGAMANEPATPSSETSQSSMNQNCDDEMKDAAGECPSDTLQNDAPTTGGQDGSAASSGTDGMGGSTGDTSGGASGDTGGTGDASGGADGGDSN